MRFTLFAGLGLSATLLAACDDKGDVIVAPDRPRASVRFINAVPDTLVTDWRFVDQIGSLSPFEVGFAFRSLTDYQGVGPGARHFKIFPGTNNLSTQNALIDETVTFTANQHYTLIHTGFSKLDQDQLLVIQETIPTVAPGDVAVRAMHLGAGIGAVDIYATHSGGSTVPTLATSGPTGAKFTDVTYGETTEYANITRLPSAIGIPLAAIPTGYSRPTGSFAAEGFVVGDWIRVSGFGSNANDGRATITGIVEQRTTGAISLAATDTSFMRTTGSFVDDGIVANSWVAVSGFGDPVNNGRFFISTVTATELIGARTGSVTLAADTLGFTRTTGSFITDGFTVGSTVRARGFRTTPSDNNGVAVVTAVTATRLTVTRTTRLIEDPATAGRSITQVLNANQAAATGRTVIADSRLLVTKSPANATAPVGTRNVLGELIFRAFAGRAATPTVRDSLVAEWQAPPGEAANTGLNLQALGGVTQGGSAVLGILVPRSVAGTGAPQTAPTTSPPSPGFLVPTFIYAIDKHPR